MQFLNRPCHLWEISLDVFALIQYKIMVVFHGILYTMNDMDLTSEWMGSFLMSCLELLATLGTLEEETKFMEVFGKEEGGREGNFSGLIANVIAGLMKLLVATIARTVGLKQNGCVCLWWFLLPVALCNGQWLEAIICDGLRCVHGMQKTANLESFWGAMTSWIFWMKHIK